MNPINPAKYAFYITLIINMLRFSDTSIRLYRKRNGSVSVRMQSHLMIHCKGGYGFRLASQLNQLDLKLTLGDGQIVSLDEYSYSDAPLFEMEHMIHDFNAAGTANLKTIKDGAARLLVEYRLFSFPGQGDPDRIDLIVPILARGLTAGRWI